VAEAQLIEWIETDPFVQLDHNKVSTNCPLDLYYINHLFTIGSSPSAPQRGPPRGHFHFGRIGEGKD